MILSGGKPTPNSLLLAVWMFAMTRFAYGGGPFDRRALAQDRERALLKSSDSNDGHVRIGWLLWQVNLEPAFRLSRFQ
ncbi:MAG: hypothetical protein DMG50_16205 [Acidobacteria bacterium]|nr:MAG: hypothetical protein DMG50_16205 [Acidobacteriota bacterium]